MALYFVIWLVFIGKAMYVHSQRQLSNWLRSGVLMKDAVPAWHAELEGRLCMSQMGPHIPDSLNASLSLVSPLSLDSYWMATWNVQVIKCNGRRYNSSDNGTRVLKMVDFKCSWISGGCFKLYQMYMNSTAKCNVSPALWSLWTGMYILQWKNLCPIWAEQIVGLWRSRAFKPPVRAFYSIAEGFTMH